MTLTRALDDTVTVSEVRRRLSEILDQARRTQRHFVILKAGQPQGVVLGTDEYLRLRELDLREQRRRHVLAQPPAAARSPQEWQASFETLTRLRDKATPLSDDELDALVNEALLEIRTPSPEAAQ